jgi:hypothetical protein
VAQRQRKGATAPKGAPTEGLVVLRAPWVRPWAR